ncbi:hypothetical protein EC912_102262 [Luteibacter rhizovicinus]|uniref:Uncharacterized protein n=1 Tax=Luteibacter rhizovicinus TaxID=242606 RepID=A0A4R3YSN5_9GAMM|nr:hypothetical protein [Luteibacter rhizovicinus]TCV95917.1 hypothetical protein EC912_102262 [Luteibacter rhizovicinus]
MQSLGLLLVCLIGGWLVYRYRDRGRLRGISLAGEHIRIGDEEWAGAEAVVLRVVRSGEATTLICRLPDGRFIRAVGQGAGWRFFPMTDEAARQALGGMSSR